MPKFKLSKFKCKKCGKLMYENGKSYGTYWRFHMCLSKNGGCGEGFWIDIKHRVDNNGYEYKT
jgi:hypothetical protein